jgi:hypothetical protein
MEPTKNKAQRMDDQPRTTGQAIIDTIDAVIDDTGDLMGGSRAAKVAGGAAIGVVAGVLLPFSILTGAVVGGAYSAWRQSQRSKL